MRGRTQRARREYGNERRRRRSYAEDAKGNTKFVWERLEAVFMRVAGHKWLGRRMEAACRCFCGLALRKLEECGGGRRRRRGYAEGAKGNTKFVWKRLEAVFMRVAGHKWLGRRMGAGCRGFCGFAWGAGLRGRTQKAQKLRRSRKRNTKIVWKSLEPVFMRVAGHKWLGRRMGAGCRGFCGLALLGLEECGATKQKKFRII